MLVEGWELHVYVCKFLRETSFVHFILVLVILFSNSNPELKYLMLKYIEYFQRTEVKTF